MLTFEIQGSTGLSNIITGESIKNLSSYLPKNKKVIILTDENVNALYAKDFPDAPVITIGMGEDIKTLSTLEYIIEKLIDFEADRSSFLVGIGGGLVCDVAGFTASVFMRGIDFGFVSSTLLSQVDASVGGKNGVNFSGYKNLVGVFNQPQFVICDPEMLKTLKPEDLKCGFAEIVKHTIIADHDMFCFLEKNHEKALSLDKGTIQKLVHNSVEIKAGIVNKDEKEKGERRKLNFGHTYGHAIEKTVKVKHGEAVSIGMLVASAISNQRGLLSVESYERIKNLLQKLNLPVTCDFDQDKVIDAMKKDKKRDGDNIHFVLINEIGSAIIEKISISELEDIIKKYKI